MIQFYKRDFTRIVYSSYLQGLSYEEIAMKLTLEGRPGVTEEMIDEVIDDCNIVSV